MAGTHGCGSGEAFGEEVIVEVGPPFTGRTADPTVDPSGLQLLLALINNRYWPIGVCGNSGLGVEFSNQNAAYAPYWEDTPIGKTVVAYACTIGCSYTISPQAASVIVAKIGDHYHILRVLNSDITFPVTGPSTICRCCGLSSSLTKLQVKITQVDPPCPSLLGRTFFLQYNNCRNDCGWYGELVLDCADCGSGSGENGLLLSVCVGCNAETESEFEDVDDWTVEVSGEVRPITEVHCGGGLGSGSGSGAACMIDVSVGPVLAGLCGHTFHLCITAVLDDDPCALEDVLIGEPVAAEACGLPNLAVGTRVIMARIPLTPLTGSGQVGGSGCDPVEYFIIRACDTAENCADNCDDPLSVESPCCGELCEDMPVALTATIEVANCSCVCDTPPEFPLTKSECLPGVEMGEWRWEDSPPSETCPQAEFYLQLDSLQLTCSSDEFGSGSGSGSGASGGRNFQLMVGGLFGTPIRATLIESHCNPTYLVFELEAAFCVDRTPGEIPPTEDLSCTFIITIVE